MNAKRPLLKFLLLKNIKEIDIKSLNEFYTPVELVTQLEALESQNLLTINWNKKIIDFHGLNFLSATLKKNEIGNYKREVPEYMKGEKIGINKPYIDN